MARKPMSDFLLEATFMERPRRSLRAIARRLYLVSPLFVVAIVLVETIGAVDARLALFGAGACALYYSVASFLGRRLPVPSRWSWQLIKSQAAILLILAGTLVLGESQRSLWLLFLLPLFRVVQYDDTGGRWVAIALAEVLVALFAAVSETTHGTTSAAILQVVASRMMWLAFLTTLMYLSVGLLQQREESELQRERFLEQLSRDMFQSSGLSACYDVLLRRCVLLVRGSRATAYVCNYKTGALSPEASVQRQGTEVVPVKVEPQQPPICFLGQGPMGLVAWAARSNQVRHSMAAGTQSWDRFRRTVSATPPRAEECPSGGIALPIYDHAASRVGCVLSIECEQPSIPESRELLEAYIHSLTEVSRAVGMSYGYLVRAEQADAMHRLGAAIDSAATEEEIWEPLVEGMMKVHRCPSAVWLVEPREGRDSLCLTASRGLEASFAASKPSTSLGTSVMGRVFVRGEGMVFGKITGSMEHWKTLDSMGISSLAVAPLVWGEEQIGVLALYMYTDEPLAPYELGFLEEVASRAAASLQRCRSRAEMVSSFSQEFATFAAHEMAGPLGALENLIETVRSACGEDAVRELRAESEDINRIRRLIGMQLGKGEMTRKRWDLAKLIGRATATLRRRTRLTTGRVTTGKLREGNYYVECDDDVVVSVLLTLLKNAATAMGPEGRISVTAHVDSHDSGLVDVYVQNFGAPIPEVDQVHVFEPGFTTKEKGWGIGLFAGRDLVRKMGGDLIFQGSSHRFGTVFQLRLLRAYHKEGEASNGEESDPRGR